MSVEKTNAKHRQEKQGMSLWKPHPLKYLRCNLMPSNFIILSVLCVTSAYSFPLKNPQMHCHTLGRVVLEII